MLSTGDLLVLVSLIQLLFILKRLFAFFRKTSCHNEEVNCNESSLNLVFPAYVVSKYIEDI